MVPFHLVISVNILVCKPLERAGFSGIALRAIPENPARSNGLHTSILTDITKWNGTINLEWNQIPKLKKPFARAFRNSSDLFLTNDASRAIRQGKAPKKRLFKDRTKFGNVKDRIVPRKKD